MNELDVSIRPLRTEDEYFLWEMLYQALFVPSGSPPFPREILSQPEISRYVEGWGRAGDSGFVAITESSGEPVGAAWLRLFLGREKGYGYVDEETPELTIAVTNAYRGKGIGQLLMSYLLAEAHGIHRAVSLSVSVDNPALRLYLRMGFEKLKEDGQSITMIKRLN